MSMRSVAILHILLAFNYHILSVIRTVLNDVRSKKNGDALQTECDFPYRYTRFEIERCPEEGDALQTEGARITARIQYVEAC